MNTKLERQDSVISILSSGIDLCRICHCDNSCGELISPCYCSGSMRWVHQGCLQHWIRASNNKACELCRYPYAMRTKLKPICGWESLPMSGSEKRRLFCSAIFHLIALACVIWSLYVLIDRTIEEVYQSELEWQFWTKIVVEAIGCLGAGILIYVWGKSYFSIINKWIAFNRTFVVVSSSPPPIKKPIPSSDTTASCDVSSKTKRPVTASANNRSPPLLPPLPPLLPPSSQINQHYHHQDTIVSTAVAASCSGSSSPLMVTENGCGCGSVGGTFPCGSISSSDRVDDNDSLRGGCQLHTPHTDSSDNDHHEEDDKYREAKELLLPQVVYVPPPPPDQCKLLGFKGKEG